MYIVLGEEQRYPNGVIMPRTSYPNNQIDPNLGKSNQINIYRYQIKSNWRAQFDLIYLMTSLHERASTTHEHVMSVKVLGT